MPQVNDQVAAVFGQMAAMLEILGGDRFRINAFVRAARVIEDLSCDLASIGPDLKQLTAINGVGKGTAQRIAEFLTTGQIQEHNQLLAKIPAGLLSLLEISGLGPKTVAVLWKKAGVESVEGLQRKLRTDELADLPGLGKKKLENLRKSLAFARTAVGRVRIGQAMPLAIWFVEKLGQLKPVRQAAFAGSLRRGKETIGDIDLIVAVAAANKDSSAYARAAKAISDAFVGLEPVRQVLVKGQTKTSVRADFPGSQDKGGIQVDLRVVAAEHFGAALLYFTGSKDLNVAMRERAVRQGTRLNEYGLYKGDKLIAAQTEQAVFSKMGLAWIPPELREGRGELVLAEQDQLPRLVEVADVKAELHAHTQASDGRWSIRQLALAAAQRGFHTVAVTDHSRSQIVANGLSIKRLENHLRDVRAVAKELKHVIGILTGSEVDILADGTLDYPDRLLEQLDVVVASPHSGLTQGPAKATQRLVKAIENPHVTMIGHPTGRLIGRREGLSPEMKQVIAAAANCDVALEINANSWRLDLNDVHARTAIEAGVKLAINTDAHGPGDLDQLIYGVLTARRAGATKSDVVNCMSSASLRRWLKRRRAV